MNTVNLGSAHEVRIEADEDGFVLFLEGAGFAVRTNIQGVAEELVKQTRPIRDWMYEGRVAAYDHSVKVPDDIDAYEPNDPKRGYEDVL